MTLRSFEYGDPAIVYERKQARSCTGCQHLEKLFERDVCMKQRRTLTKCHFFIVKVRNV